MLSMQSLPVTPYRILQVSSNASDAKLHSAFRRRIHALKKGRLSDDQFQLVCRAYECLGDVNRRKLYDETGEWHYKLSAKDYTLQQLANERILCVPLRLSLAEATTRQINTPDPGSGYTLLYCAARTGNDEAVQIAIEKGAQLDLLQRDGDTALHAAAFFGHSTVVRCLLEHGANSSLHNQSGKCAEKASFDRHIRRVFIELKESPFVQLAAQRLSWLQANKPKVDAYINHRYYRCHQTLLHCASKKGFLEIVCWLVEFCSADLNIVDLNGNSALHLAAINEHASVVQYLLKNGANPHLLNQANFTAEEESQRSGDDLSPTFRCMYDWNVFNLAESGTRWWFEHYFGTNSPDMTNAYGVTLLYVACRHGQVSVARWLLEHGAKVDSPLEQGSRSTPLHGAAFHGHTDVVELLLSYHADLTLRNAYGLTVFDECQSAMVKAMLENSRERLCDGKFITIHIYEKRPGQRSKEQPAARLSLPYDMKHIDLLRALPPPLQGQLGYFTIAGRALQFEEDDSSILTAVYRARYSKSRFIETPLHLTFCAGFLTASEPIRTDLDFDYARLESNFLIHGDRLDVESKKGMHFGKTYCIADLRFCFFPDSNSQHFSITIQQLPLPCPDGFHPEGCLGLFRISSVIASTLKPRARVYYVTGVRCRLYQLAAPSPYWLTTGSDPTHLSLVKGIYGLFRSIDIIPGLLSLPLDMFIANDINRPLMSRATPVPCKCLQLRPHRPESFPLIVYHGTLISHIRSIVMDGLVLPETVVSNGHFVQPPAHHVPLYVDCAHINNFAGAIFGSPSIFYSANAAYAMEFQSEGATFLPVLECSVKAGSYAVFARTVPTYIGHPDDNLLALDWRIEDPANIEINSILFVKKQLARDFETNSRSIWM